MPILARRQFLFGDKKQYKFEFIVNTTTFPGSTTAITTIITMSTPNISKEQGEPELSELVNFLSDLCIEYNANYDGFHNDLTPYSSDESGEIAKLVNDAVLSKCAIK